MAQSPDTPGLAARRLQATLGHLRPTECAASAPPSKDPGTLPSDDRIIRVRPHFAMNNLLEKQPASTTP